MFENSNILFIVLFIVGIIILYYILTRPSKNTKIIRRENFGQTTGNTSSIFSKQKNQVKSQSNDIQNYLVDTIECHPDCCGTQWPMSDGLTVQQIQNNLLTQQKDNQYILTNYTCANGPNGVGCPCINKDAYAKLVNRGQNLGYHDAIVKKNASAVL